MSLKQLLHQQKKVFDNRHVQRCFKTHVRCVKRISGENNHQFSPILAIFQNIPRSLNVYKITTFKMIKSSDNCSALIFSTILKNPLSDIPCCLLVHQINDLIIIKGCVDSEFHSIQNEKLMACLTIRCSPVATPILFGGCTVSDFLPTQLDN